MKALISVLGMVMILSGCIKKDNQAEIDDQIIQAYLTAHNLVATKDPSGIYYITTVTGTGASPTLASTVVVKYKGSLINGTVFDQTDPGQTASYALAGLIRGWQIGLPFMKKGGESTFFIPSSLGYGNTAIGPIPGSSVLIFDIELVDVK